MKEIQGLLHQRRMLLKERENLLEAIYRINREIFETLAPVGSWWQKVSNPVIKGEVCVITDEYIRIKHSRARLAPKVTLDELVTNWAPVRNPNNAGEIEDKFDY